MRLKHYFLILGWRRTCTRAWPLNELLAGLPPEARIYACTTPIFLYAAFDQWRVGRGVVAHGDLLALWRDAGRLRLNGWDLRTSLKDFLGPNFEDEVADWIRAGADHAITHGPLAGCVSVMQSWRVRRTGKRSCQFRHMASRKRCCGTWLRTCMGPS
ncbi:hypothetical protein [uncultured Tateyamaria sp.]|uniref:hypothetical protein n=1 Tax=uncultured Tateyamaria sp. TaxID=455651 RepID=UPI002627E101|nr:hypothetical protein [uncultured Tateyamaria sp.]